MNRDLKNFIKISRYAGERFDLIQAAGGNTSVKLDNGEMLIKASGFLLSEIDQNNGYARVITKDIISILESKEILYEKDKKKREIMTSKLIENAVIGDFVRPSIETLLHSLLKKYTLHTHPILVIKIAIQKKWKEIFQKIFDNNILCVEYDTPGIELAISLNKKFDNFKIPEIIFLQNHGLIVSSSNADELIKLNDFVINRIENFLKLDFSKYRNTNFLSSIFNSVFNLNLSAYFSEPISVIYTNFEEKSIDLPFTFPDSFVYCGYEIINVNQSSIKSKIKIYYDKYNEPPKVLKYNSYFYIFSQSIKKSKEIEEVLMCHFLSIDNLDFNDINSLSLNEFKYLGNWDAEKLRQKM